MSEALSRRDTKLAEAERRVAELAAAHSGVAETLAERETELVTMRQEAARMREQLQAGLPVLSIRRVELSASQFVAASSIRQFDTENMLLDYRSHMRE